LEIGIIYFYYLWLKKKRKRKEEKKFILKLWISKENGKKYYSNNLWLDNTYVLYLDYRYVLLLLSMYFVIWKTNILRNPNSTVQKTLRFMFLMWLWYEEEIKRNCDLLGFSGNWVKHLSLRIWEEISWKIVISLFQLLSWKLSVSISCSVWSWENHKFLI